ncbi:hypothetical protein GCM10007973_00410 [Polymorphobacter multimanifer]|nr:hypothetical protein GCM10007973_00410 [Polymorphobacter multimanifer]
MRREEQVIDAEAVVALPGAGLIVPEGPYAAARVEAADGVGPALPEQGAEGGAAFRLHERVVLHGARVPDVVVMGDDVVIAGEDDGSAEAEQGRGVRLEAGHPGELVIELGAGLGVAVGEVDAGDAHTADLGFEIA